MDSKFSQIQLGENRFFSDSLTQLVIHWVVALIFVAAPAGFVLTHLYQGQHQGQSNDFYWAAGTFGVLAFFFFKGAILRLRSWLTIGRMPLVLNPFPGSIGGDVGGSIECNLPAQQLNAQPLYLTLTCYHSYPGKEQRIEVKRWTRDCMAEVLEAGGKQLLQFRFELPQNLPETSEKSDNYHFWQLELHAEISGHKIDRNYQIPVYETRQCSDEHFWHLDWQSHSKADDFKEQSIEKVLKIEQIQQGLKVYSPAFHHIGFKLIWVLLGLVIGAASGYLLFATPASWVMAEGLLMATLIGCLIGLASFFQIFRSLDARIETTVKGNVTIYHRFLGMPIWRTQIPRETISQLSLKPTGSIGAGTWEKAFYDLCVEHSRGVSLMATNLVGKDNAQYALEAIAALTRLSASPETMAKGRRL